MKGKHRTIIYLIVHFLCVHANLPKLFENPISDNIHNISLNSENIVKMNTLHNDVEKRYAYKISKIGYDPYAVDEKLFNSEYQSLPAIYFYDVMSYLLFSSTVSSEEQKRNYKSMDSYKLFIDGWIRYISAKEENEMHIVKSKVYKSVMLIKIYL